MAKLTPMKKQKAEDTPAKKKAEEKVVMFEEDDDDDDDEDDDLDDSLEVDEDGEKDDDDDMDEDDDDDEEDDDDEDDDDEDDEDDEKASGDKKEAAGKGAKAASTKKASPEKQQVQPNKRVQQTALKRTAPVSPKQKQTPQLKRQAPEPANTKANKKAKLVDTIGEEIRSRLERSEARDRRTLFLKGFPVDTDTDTLKALSSDILDIRRPRNKMRFAYLEFASEELAEKNKKLLTGKKLEDDELILDYVGSKSQYKGKGDEAAPRPVNKQKLYVGGLPDGTTSEDLQKAFPGCDGVSIPHGKFGNKNFAFIFYKSVQMCKDAHDEAADKVINGKPVTVMYASVRSNEPRQGKKPTAQKEERGKGKKPQQQQQKRKPKAAAQSDDEEDDDDDDDDDDESD